MGTQKLSVISPITLSFLAFAVKLLRLWPSHTPESLISMVDGSKIHLQLSQLNFHLPQNQLPQLPTVPTVPTLPREFLTPLLRPNGSLPSLFNLIHSLRRPTMPLLRKLPLVLMLLRPSTLLPVKRAVL